jgi:hypothetical protein
MLQEDSITGVATPRANTGWGGRWPPIRELRAEMGLTGGVLGLNVVLSSIRLKK